MDKFSDIPDFLQKAIPILLILAITWLFGAFTSKMKKQVPPPDGPVSKKAEDSFPEAFQWNFPSGDQSEPSAERFPPPQARQEGVSIGKQASGPRSGQLPAKPITPKWWGA
jgi:hypothetical protein